MSEHGDARAIARPAAKPLAQVAVSVDFALRRTGNRWSPRAWRLEAVRQDDAGPLRIELYRDEAQGYYLNVTTAEPSIFVLWRQDAADSGDEPPQAVAVTVSYDEAARWMDAGEQVDRVPMPTEMAAWLTECVNLHYEPELQRKRSGPKASFMDRGALQALAAAQGRGPRRGRGDGSR